MIHQQTLEFLKELADNNNREWFQANKDVYERACRGPMQRLLAELTRFTDRPALVHGMLLPMTEAYRAQGVAMLETTATRLTMPVTCASTLAIGPKPRGIGARTTTRS